MIGGIRMKKCPWCGKNVPEQNRICPSCGYDFSRGEMSSFYDQRQQKAEKSKIRHKNEMVIVATLAIIAGGSYIFDTHQEQTEARQNIQQTTRTISDSSESSSVVSSSSSSSAKSSSSSSEKAKKASSSSSKSESKKSTTKSSQSSKTKEVKESSAKKNVKKQAAKSSSKATKKSNTKVAKKATPKKQAVRNNEAKLQTNMKPNEFAAAVATYAAQKNVSKWKDVVNNSDNGILIKETTEPDIVNYLSAKGTGTVYVAFNSKDSNREVVYSAYTINQDGSVNIYEFGTPSAPHNGDIYNPVETVSQQDMIKYLNSHKQAKNVKQASNKVGIDHE